MLRSLIATFLLFAASYTFAQSADKPAVHGVPAGISLLSGYSHEPLAEIDGARGRISEAGGLTIRYAIGPWEGNWARRQIQNSVWSREQNQGYRRLYVALAESGVLYVSFVYPEPLNRRGQNVDFKANFSGEVGGNEDIAEFLIMVLGYEREGQPIDSLEKAGR